MTLFVAVAESQSFARAAEKLGMSAPAVTRAIAALENALGCRLLERTTRSVRLSESGGRYLEDCRRILQEVQEAEGALRGAQSEPQGSLQVTAPVQFGQLLVMPVVREFLDRYPRVQARAVLLDRVVNLMEEGHDVAVRIGELPDSSLLARKVGEVRRVLVGSPDYLKRAGLLARVKDLASHRLVAVNEMGPVHEWRFARSTIRLQPALTVNTVQAGLDAVRAGWGLGRFLSYQVKGRDLEVLLPEEEPAPWPVHILYGAGHRKVTAFVDLLADRLRAALGPS